MRTRLLSMLALAGATVALGCGDDKKAAAHDPPLGITERDDLEVTIKAVDHAPTDHKIKGTRVSADGRRKVEHWDGLTWASFLDDPSDIPIDMDATYADGYTLLCAPVAHNLPLASVHVVCGVRAPGGSSFDKITVDGDPNSFLHDVCLGQGGNTFQLLVSAAETPYFGAGMTTDSLGRQPCGAMAWSPGAGWQPAGDQTQCSCARLDGAACSDPCRDGSGTFQNGSCQVAGAFKCDDGNPLTADYCTGVPTDLCQHVEEVGDMSMP